MYFCPLGVLVLFHSTSKELDVFIATFLKSNLSNHLSRNFIQTMSFSFPFPLAYFFNIIHLASWTLLSVHHTSYSPRTGVWHLGEGEAREKINQTGITLKDDWINYHLPGVVWKTAISLGHQPTFSLPNSRISLDKGPWWRNGFLDYGGPSENVRPLS